MNTRLDELVGEELGLIKSRREEKDRRRAHAAAAQRLHREQECAQADDPATFARHMAARALASIRAAWPDCPVAASDGVNSKVWRLDGDGVWSRLWAAPAWHWVCSPALPLPSAPPDHLRYAVLGKKGWASVDVALPGARVLDTGAIWPAVRDALGKAGLAINNRPLEIPRRGDTPERVEAGLLLRWWFFGIGPDGGLSQPIASIAGTAPELPDGLAGVKEIVAATGRGVAYYPSEVER